MDRKMGLFYTRAGFKAWLEQTDFEEVFVDEGDVTLVTEEDV